MAIFDKPAEVMLDSGCSSIIVKESLVPSKYKLGKFVKVYDYLGIPNYFPQVRCLIKSKFYTGWTKAIAAPIKFADVLIGLIPGVKLPTEPYPPDDPSLPVPDKADLPPSILPNHLDAKDPSSLIHPETSSPILTPFIDNQDLRELLNRLRLHGLTAGISKCYFGYPKIKIPWFAARRQRPHSP
nr:uncharacterized protein LOC113814046 [Penaeus vannamei]